MFDGLQKRFSSVFDRLRGRGALSESDVDAALADIRTALIDADVALPVVKDFIDQRKNDRMGLVIFSAKAYTVCPLTTDYHWLKENLLRVRLGLVQDGTAIGSGLATSLMRSDYRDHAARFLHPAVNPTEGDAVDRRFRPPTEDAHLATWLDWQRGGPPTVADTLVLTFGGETVPDMDTLFLARGRYAGDALVWRRPAVAAAGADSIRSRP